MSRSPGGHAHGHASRHEDGGQRRRAALASARDALLVRSVVPGRRRDHGERLPEEVASGPGGASERIVPADSSFVPLDEFAPQGDVLDFSEFGGRKTKGLATVGIYGKLGRFKGMPALLRAVRAGLELGKQVQLAAMVQGRPEEERGFAELLDELDLRDRVVRVPFLPHWRVPAFLRACDVVCCLEQDFPIRTHSPIIAQEVLATGRPLLLSQEIAAKQPEAHRLAHGYNCWIVRDSTDHHEIARSLMQATSASRGWRSRWGPAVGRSRSTCSPWSGFPVAHEAAMRLAVDGPAPIEAAAPGRRRSGPAWTVRSPEPRPPRNSS